MTDPTRTKTKVLSALRDGRLIRSTTTQYPEIRGWVLELLPQLASLGEVEAACFAVFEVKRLDYELGFTSRDEQDQRL